MESQNRFTADIFLFQYPGMVFQMGTGHYTGTDAYYCVSPAYELKFAALRQFLFGGNDVYCLSGTIHALQGGINLTVYLIIKYFRSQYVGNQCDSFAFQQAGAEYDFLELGILRV